MSVISIHQMVILFQGHQDACYESALCISSVDGHSVVTRKGTEKARHRCLCVQETQSVHCRN